jgi:hypothetical protein
MDVLSDAGLVVLTFALGAGVVPTVSARSEIVPALVTTYAIQIALPLGASLLVAARRRSTTVAAFGILGSVRNVALPAGALWSLGAEASIPGTVGYLLNLAAMAALAVASGRLVHAIGGPADEARRADRR